ncbi:Fc receptor-like A isoform X3 [Phacochoerus africanus]|uniref:Fc receptor-like A isoform X3 n=1 Tax=Phacochoerus africanus TaxID=41426 RepID=UPI001FD8DE62|nr:Fc receptor-like A isoform X3 [Phacochoerus africanus]
MLKKVSVLEAAGDLNTVTMKLGYVFTTGVFSFPPPMLWAAQMLLVAASFSGSLRTMASPAASFDALQCKGPLSSQESRCHMDEDLTDLRDVDFQIKGYTFSEPFHLIVSYELFPTPVLKAIPSAELREGSPVTLSCQTKLPLQRSAARLLFSFYKDGRRVRSRGPSSEFQIPTASEAHSGSYWCEAATEDNQVWKQSPKLEIKVQSPSSSAAPPILNPAPQKSAAPETTSTERPGPLPPRPTPSSKDPGFSSPLKILDPHLRHQVRELLKQMQDVRDLLGHLVMELRSLSGHLKLEITKGPAEYK